MKILGFNKLTLTDYPGKVAAIIFFGGCNFRCPFCHNAPLIDDNCPSQQIDQQEVLDYLKQRANMIEGVVLSGGEPLLNDATQLAIFLKKIKDLNLSIKLDTNGSFPFKIQYLLYKKVIDYIAMDIKSSLNTYSEVAGCQVDISQIILSMMFIKKSKIKYEFRTTLVDGLHTDKDLIDLSNLLKGEKSYFIQSFANSENILNNPNNQLKPYDLNKAKTILIKKIPKLQIRE